MSSNNINSDVGAWVVGVWGSKQIRWWNITTKFIFEEQNIFNDSSSSLLIRLVLRAKFPPFPICLTALILCILQESRRRFDKAISAYDQVLKTMETSFLTWSSLLGLGLNDTLNLLHCFSPSLFLWGHLIRSKFWTIQLLSKKTPWLYVITLRILLNQELSNRNM